LNTLLQIALTGKLEDILEYPGINISQKKELVKAVLGDRTDKYITNFFMLLLDNGRQKYLPDIIRAYKEMADQYKSILNVEIISAMELDKKHLDEIKKSSVILLVFIMLSLISFNIGMFERVSWYYIVIYIISSVFYLRVMRSIKFGYIDNKNKDVTNTNAFEKKYKKINLISSFIMCFITVIMSIRAVRDLLVKILSFS
jgi:hypothetical protein